MSHDLRRVNEQKVYGMCGTASPRLNEMRGLDPFLQSYSGFAAWVALHVTEYNEHRTMQQTRVSLWHDAKQVLEKRSE